MENLSDSRWASYGYHRNPIGPQLNPIIVYSCRNFRMWNLIPKTAPAYSLLFGKRPLQRVVVGAKGHQLEIPVSVVSSLTTDTSASYVGNKYESMPWEEFVKVKTHANNLIHANVKSALGGAPWMADLKRLAQGQTGQVESGVVVGWAREAAKGQWRYPVAK